MSITWNLVPLGFLSWNCKKCRGTLISAASFDRSDVFVYSNTKCSYGAAHVLLITETCDEIHYIVSGACGEVPHLVDGGGILRWNLMFDFHEIQAV